MRNVCKELSTDSLNSSSDWKDVFFFLSICITSFSSFLIINFFQDNSNYVFWSIVIYIVIFVYVTMNANQCGIGLHTQIGHTNNNCKQSNLG